MTNMTKEDIIVVEPTEPLLPTDEELVANTKAKFKTIVDDFIKNTIITLKDENYSSDIVWQYNLSKDLSIVKISFKLPYGYFSEDLVVEVVKNNPPTRKKIYFQIITQDPYAPKIKLEFLFKKQREILSRLIQMQTQFGIEVDAIEELDTGSELKTQLDDLFLTYKNNIQAIDITDTFTYLDWVYNI